MIEAEDFFYFMYVIWINLVNTSVEYVKTELFLQNAADHPPHIMFMYNIHVHVCLLVTKRLSDH